jgi:Ca2+-transporting ATPase
MSAAAIVLATEFGLFQRILQTTSLSLAQWAVCLVAGLVVVIPTELRKVVLRRRAAEVPSEGRTS